MSWETTWPQIKSYLALCWQYLANPWVLGSLVGAIALLAVLIWMSRRQPARVRAFINDHGFVEISRVALVDVIRSACEKVDIEKRPGVAIRTRRGKLHVDVRIRLLCTRNLVEVSNILQRSLIETLQEGMGIRKLGTINVIVTGIRTKSGKEARAELPLISSDQENEISESESFEIVAQEKSIPHQAAQENTRTDPIEISSTSEPISESVESESNDRAK